MHLVIFEGPDWADLAPLTLCRPAFLLACGAGTLLEKQLRHQRPSRVTLVVRPELAEWVKRRVAPALPVPTRVNEPLDDGPALLLNGATLLHRPVTLANRDSALVEAGRVYAAQVSSGRGIALENLMGGLEALKGLAPLERELHPIGRAWDLITHAQAALREDFAQIGPRPPAGGPYHVVNEGAVHADPSARIAPGAVLDASNGPIILGASASIGANAVLLGPCCVGAGSIVNTLTTIRPGTCIGPLCKVGGEVSNSTILGYSNKAHEGFLGDSYVGQWANLGAGTTTSNLKNTYGAITARVGKQEVRTGRQFLGSIIGDHAKTAIGTRLMAGSCVGFCSMLALSAIAPKFTPSFSFVTDGGAEGYDLEKALAVMKSVYARRGQAWEDIEEAVARYVARIVPGLEG